VEDPFVHTANTTLKSFGMAVDIDGDLSCIYHTGFDWGDYINLYHKDDDSSKWIQFDTISGSTCSISGDTIAAGRQLYKYDRDMNKVIPIQDPISPWYAGKALSKDYLVIWSEEKTVSIYHRNEMNQTFTLTQQLNISDRSWRYNQLALDNDILVVDRDNHTRIYSLQDGDWVESITLDESYSDIKFSGRTLLATKNNETSSSSEIYSFNIQDCTQDMPTRSPTLTPPSSSSCFDADEGGQYGILYNAVRTYVVQDCANNEECDIGQTYGWPMNSWCIGIIKDMSYLFLGMDTFNEDISNWNTSSVTDMSFMFSGASLFNQDLSNFDTSSVTKMNSMFSGARAFNGTVSK